MFCQKKAGSMSIPVSIDRLYLPFFGKNQGKRMYDKRIISRDDL